LKFDLCDIEKNPGIKMAAILNEQRSLTGTFRQSAAISQEKIGPVDPGVCQIIDRNQIKDGCQMDEWWRWFSKGTRPIL
jgi:hypothetical protein